MSFPRWVKSLSALTVLVTASCADLASADKRAENSTKPVVSAQASPVVAARPVEGAVQAASVRATPMTADSKALSPPVRQIIIAFKGSSRAPASVTRTKEEAEARARLVLEKARKNAKFEDLVLEFSDDAHKQNDRGYVGPIPANTVFRDLYSTAAALERGGVEIGKSPFGYHVLKRID